MPSMLLFLLFGMVVPGPSSPCFSVTSSLIPILENNRKDILLRMMLLKYPMRRIWSPTAFHLSIYSLTLCRNPCLGHIILFFVFTNVMCYE